MIRKIDESAWHDVPWLKGMYQVTDEGDVRSLLRDRKMILKQAYEPRKGGMVVQISKPDGRRGKVQVSKLVMDTFVGERPAGMVRFHLNGDVMDNRVSNLIFLTQSQVGKITGGKFQRKPVAKVRYTGEIVETYVSAEEAARQNHVTSVVITNRCRHRTKLNTLDSKGCTFVYMEDLYKLKGDSMEW